ncbi:MAG: PAS domain S-box protein [Anaerolineae bacterium]
MDEPIRILIVEENTLLRRRLVRSLRRHCPVWEASTGAEAWQCAIEVQPALILLSVTLPDGDAAALCHRIKAQPELRDSLIVLMADADTPSAQLVELVSEVADDLLIRPIPACALSVCLPLWSQRKQAIAQLRFQMQRYRQIVREAPLMGIITRNEGGKPIIVDCNSAFLTALGYAREEVIGRPLADFYTPASARALLDGGGYARALAGRISIPEERQLVVCDGRVIETLLVARPDVDAAGNVVGTWATYMDITERKHAEEALRESEARFRRIAENAWDIIYRYRLQPPRGFEYVNPAATRITGYTPEEHYADPDLGFKLVHPDDRPLLELLTQEGSAFLQPIELRWQHKDGHTIWTEQLNVPIYDDAGNLVAIEGIARDITARKEAELLSQRHLREQELLARVATASLEATSIEQLGEVACQELARVFGLPYVAILTARSDRSELQVIAAHQTEGSPPLRGMVIPLPPDNALLKALLESQAPMVVEDAQVDPRMAPWQHLVAPYDVRALMLVPLILAGEMIGAIMLAERQVGRFTLEDALAVHNVASQLANALMRIRAEAELIRLSTAIEQSAESVVITDKAARIVYVNPAFERLTGYSRAEVMGQNQRILKSGQQDAAFYRTLWATITSGQPWHGRLVNRRKDGSLYTEEATITPVTDKRGRITHYIKVARDITRELQLEQQFLSAQRLEAVGRLTAGIAHDFNNLLTVINGFAEIQQQYLPTDHPTYVYSKRILETGKRAATLVNQLLAFARKQPIQPQVLDLNRVIGEMEALLQRTLGEDIRLDMQLAPELWPVKMDPTQIEQVVMNLAVNARDAMPRGGALTIETANVVLDEEYVARHLGSQPGEYVLLSVTDTGIGMSREVQARIFEPFFTTKEVGKGSGLGLAAVYGIVKQNHGNIWVYSEEGRGTTFKIYLPRVRAATLAHPKQPAQVADLPRGNETILVVEDSPEVRELAMLMLHQLGYRVLEASSGGEALRMVEEHPGDIHLLLTDVVMPDMSGKALADQLSALRPGLRVLYMSGYTSNVIVQHGMLPEGIALLEKPFTMASLAQRVRAALDR